MKMAWSRIPLLLSGAAAAVLLASPVMAQIGRGDAPVEITSKDASYLQNEGRGIYTGDVVATQADSRITTDKLTVVCTKSKPVAGSQDEPACEAMEQLIAEGNVFYTAPDVKIRGDRALYDYPTDTITITGDVILSRGTEGVVRGTQVVYKVGEGRSIITAGKNRVTTILVPASKQKPADGATTPAPAAPAPAPRPN
jgi:lipopolysaccharide export system protein LptA